VRPYLSLSIAAVLSANFYATSSEVDERIYNLPKGIDLDRVWRASAAISTISWARKRFDGRRRAIALQRARRMFWNTALRTSIRFGSYTWNMQGGLLP
jgi:hypothetical protein